MHRAERRRGEGGEDGWVGTDVSGDADRIEAAVYQSNRYITDRFLPDKAIDVIDEVGASVKPSAKRRAQAIQIDLRLLARFRAEKADPRQDL